MRIFLFFLFLAFNHVYSQTTYQKLLTAVEKMEADSQMRHALIGFYVVDAKTGKQVFAHHAEIGLAPGSTQKLFTSGAALDLLHPGYSYITKLGYAGRIKDGELLGDLLIEGSGDPTLGSWRYGDTKEDTILDDFVRAVKERHIKKIGGYISSFEKPKVASGDGPLRWIDNPLPDGWIWQDIGNYYGAGPQLLNWRENQYDLIFKRTEHPGTEVQIAGTKPALHNITFESKVVTGDPNSGDNAYIYLPPYSTHGEVRGSIPAGKGDFTISGSMPSPSGELIAELTERLQKEGITVEKDVSKVYMDSAAIAANDSAFRSFFDPYTILEHYSPSLDSINYWFLKKSINLYGEALIKTLAWENDKDASTENGVEVVKDFWNKHGIDKAAINIIDGSGLSPQNRVTAKAEVQVLQYAKTRPWINSFYNALPEINGMKIKSGSIGGARSFAGYHTAKNGNQYIFSIIVNNYNGSSSAIVQKIYKLLDILK